MNKVENTPLEKRDKEHCKKPWGWRARYILKTLRLKKGIKEDQIRAALRLKRKKLNKNMVRWEDTWWHYKTLPPERRETISWESTVTTNARTELLKNQQRKDKLDIVLWNTAQNMRWQRATHGKRIGWIWAKWRESISHRKGWRKTWVLYKLDG